MENLTKIYQLKGHKKEIKALDKINLAIEAGEIFGLIGPNGAGKTTLIEILTTLKQPTSGHVMIDGIDLIKKPKLAKSRLSLMLENSMLYHRMTGYDNLKFFCKIYKVPNYKKKIPDIVEEFELTKWLNQYVEYYSSGMKMKLALCRTLLLERKIMFLDEPTLGLDVKTKSFIINKLKKSNKTIFLTSHDMSIVDKLCDRIAFINNGNIIRIGTKKQVKQLFQKGVIIEIDILKNKESIQDSLENQPFITDLVKTEKGFEIRLNSRENFQNLLQLLVKYKILGIREQETTLENLFLKLA